MALVESSNDAAEALAELDGRSQFIELMNLKAGELGLFSTHFSTPTGLEAEDNFSTVKNLAVLSAFILREHPLIFSISAQPSVIILSENDKLHHRAFNTNELLISLSGLENLRIVGGKTGYTQEAGGCIVLLTENPTGDCFINIVLGAVSPETRFSEMRKLVEAFN
jgi:D-alanyl-D-alanine carboxypeptidase (penicillin-binding protein 5/6)